MRPLDAVNEKSWVLSLDHSFRLSFKVFKQEREGKSRVGLEEAKGWVQKAKA